MRLLTIDEAAERLGVTKRQVNSFIQRGRLPWINVSLSAATGKPRKRIDESDLFAFIADRRVQPVPHKNRKHI